MMKAKSRTVVINLMEMAANDCKKTIPLAGFRFLTVMLHCVDALQKGMT
jgi:hypothetical protein